MPAAKGQEIRKRRQRLGIKLREMSDRSGVGYMSLANAESYNASLSIEKAWLLAHIFGCEADDLVETNGTAA